jgi:hypothetical protein
MHPIYLVIKKGALGSFENISPEFTKIEMKE